MLALADLFQCSSLDTTTSIPPWFTHQYPENSFSQSPGTYKTDGQGPHKTLSWPSWWNSHNKMMLSYVKSNLNLDTNPSLLLSVIQKMSRLSLCSIIFLPPLAKPLPDKKSRKEPFDLEWDSDCSNSCNLCIVAVYNASVFTPELFCSDFNIAGCFTRVFISVYTFPHVWCTHLMHSASYSSFPTLLTI